MGILLEEVQQYCNPGTFPTTTKSTILVADSNASRLQRFAVNPDYDIVPFEGAKIDQIARIAEAIIHPGIKNIIILGGIDNLEPDSKGVRKHSPKLDQNVGNKLMRIAKRNTSIRVAFLEILLRMQEWQ